jgi:hypothetical protein
VRLDREMKIKTTYVPFKGTGDLIASVLGGHVSATMSYSTLAIQQKGKMRMLAVATEKRLPQFPDVPTFRELGIELGRRRLSRHRRSEGDAACRAQAGLRHDGIDQQGSRASQEDVRGRLRGRRRHYEMMPGFMKERTQEYLNSAKTLGLVK